MAVAHMEVVRLEAVRMAVAHMAVAPIAVVHLEVAPMEAVRMTVVPMEVAPMEAVHMAVIPMEVVPMEVVPMEVVPREVVPREVAHTAAVPSALEAMEATATHGEILLMIEHSKLVREFDQLSVGTRIDFKPHIQIRKSETCVGVCATLCWHLDQFENQRCTRNSFFYSNASD
jgi:hypothetical protein